MRTSAEARAAILAAEDRRPTDDAGLAPLREGLTARDPLVQQAAVRALGRLERASLVPVIAPLLDSPVAGVRIAAANALGQAVFLGEPGAASAPLIARLGTESDPQVLGVIARTLGRLPYQQEAEIRAAERALLDIAPRVESEATALANVAHGFEALSRRATKLGTLSADARIRLRTLARYGVQAAAAGGTADASQASQPASNAADAPADAAARVRRLGVGALVAARESNVPLLRQVLQDPDDQVRRLGVVWLGITDDMPLRDAALRQAAADASAMVRYEALRTEARVREAAVASGGGGAAAAGTCALEIAALGDPDANVVLLAIDMLGRCADRQEAADRLLPIVAGLVSAPRGAADSLRASGLTGTWHAPAHALLSLARVAPDRAGAPLSQAAAHAAWQVRMYAARAAGVLKDRATLDTLAADADDNVRNAAVEALQALVGHEADAQYIAQLDRADYQLLRTAARALAGTTQKAAAVGPLLQAFVRISADRRDTSRDARLALLDASSETGGPVPAAVADADAVVARLQPFLADFDPVVAARVAEILTAWTGRAAVAAPKPLPVIPVPSAAAIARDARTRAVVRMTRGGRALGTFTLALDPETAPTAVARFVRLARAGYFNGLTFHRVEPNFVIQGGSPHANEYWGDGPYTRDEVDLVSNLRGTLGISTRGRDTGDGQIFVNLVDNVRLDHNYTVFAEVIDGMPVIDTVLEGDTIARVELRTR